MLNQFYKGVLKMTLQSELNITKEELTIIQEIAKSHPYFPELALDDFTFENSLAKQYGGKKVGGLVNNYLVNIKGDSLTLVKAFAKEYWNDILNSIPVLIPLEINRKFLESKDFKLLKEVYHTLTPKSPVGLSKDKIINEILTFYQEKKDMVKQGEKTEKKVAAPKKEAAIKEGMTPKEAAAKAGMNPSALRRILRKLYGKTEGTWAISEKQLEDAMEAYKKDQAETAKRRSERLAKARAAKSDSKKEAKPAKASK